MKCRRIADNRFSLVFYHPVDLKRSLEEGPWSFDESLIVLNGVEKHQNLMTLNWNGWTSWSLSMISRMSREQRTWLYALAMLSANSGWCTMHEDDDLALMSMIKYGLGVGVKNSLGKISLLDSFADFLGDGFVDTVFFRDSLMDFGRGFSKGKKKEPRSPASYGQRSRSSLPSYSSRFLTPLLNLAISSKLSDFSILTQVSSSSLFKNSLSNSVITNSDCVPSFVIRRTLRRQIRPVGCPLLVSTL
ncbi:hypothetical protein Salat_1661900 [Sesamum alatum]|uniref:DUF4283 domain-containing protein n=1 Tax=Sesamum alatum TaxID=300844 RepID=A0AAE2CJP8_9LAMI|nr:hypothetical protein Salat_1661900 [Sesamum alatum]